MASLGPNELIITHHRTIWQHVFKLTLSCKCWYIWMIGYHSISNANDYQSWNIASHWPGRDVRKNNHRIWTKNKYQWVNLMQERCNSIANTLELHLSCTNPSIYSVHEKFLWVIRQCLMILTGWSDIWKSSSDISVEVFMNSFSDDQTICLMILNKSSDIFQNQWAMSDGPMALSEHWIYELTEVPTQCLPFYIINEVGHLTTSVDHLAEFCQNYHLAAICTQLMVKLFLQLRFIQYFDCKCMKIPYFSRIDSHFVA